MFTVEDAQPDSKLTLSTLCWWWWWASWLLLEVALLKKKDTKIMFRFRSWVTILVGSKTVHDFFLVSQTNRHMFPRCDCLHSRHWSMLKSQQLLKLSSWGSHLSRIFSTQATHRSQVRLCWIKGCKLFWQWTHTIPGAQVNWSRLVSKLGDLRSKS